MSRTGSRAAAAAGSAAAVDTPCLPESVQTGRSGTAPCTRCTPCTSPPRPRTCATQSSMLGWLTSASKANWRATTGSRPGTWTTRRNALQTARGGGRRAVSQEWSEFYTPIAGGSSEHKPCILLAAAETIHP
eukprot:6185883-Pleurochrysis_carterae.AAC.1